MAKRENETLKGAEKGSEVSVDTAVILLSLRHLSDISLFSTSSSMFLFFRRRRRPCRRCRRRRPSCCRRRRRRRLGLLSSTYPMAFLDLRRQI